MLVLSRKLGEKVVIVGPGLPDEGIVLTLLSVKGRDQARIGFEAPADVTIFRQELASFFLPPAGPAEAACEPPDGGRDQTNS